MSYFVWNKIDHAVVREDAGVSSKRLAFPKAQRSVSEFANVLFSLSLKLRLKEERSDALLF